MANLLGGGFLVVAVFAFPPVTAAWLGFAVSIALAVFGLAMAASAIRGVGSGERIVVTALGGLTCLIASWTIVASLVFIPTTAIWLIFASACAHVGISMLSLVIREVTTEQSFTTSSSENAKRSPRTETTADRPAARLDAAPDGAARAWVSGPGLILDMYLNAVYLLTGESLDLVGGQTRC